MWLVPKSMKNPSSKALTTRFSLRKTGRRDLEGTLTSYCSVVKHLLAKNASEEVITEKASKIEAITQKSNQSAKKHSRTLWDKVIR